MAFRVDSPEALTKLGTLTTSWLPDKGNLTIHRLQILRGEETIDLIADGTRFDVLRRETDLERRSLNGVLTATVAMPGLRVGDIIRISQTITTRDQALDGAVQFTQNLLTKPIEMGFGRVVVSWPEDEDISWRGQASFTPPEPVLRDGYRTVAVTMPLPEPTEMPEDAPERFKLEPALQFGSFGSWSDVSRTMAQHFTTEGTIAANGLIAREIARIEDAAKSPLDRAALALRTVQDEISYLANGMNGGNYLPQSPADTWSQRFGDCKAKSLLLLAMLREMGIESEAVLVKSTGGDTVSTSLPLPSAFDHVIVRANIDGVDYWLDGTSAGTRADTMYEVPDFRFGLPLRADGADLMPIEQRWPKAPDRILRVTYDFSAGIDLPVLYEAVVEARGIIGSRLRTQATETDTKAQLDYAAGFMENIVGEGVVYETSVTYDEESGIGRIHAKGMLDPLWSFDRGQGSFDVVLPSTNLEFQPDRARAEWRDIPYMVGGPAGYVEKATFILPDGGEGYSLAGLAEIDSAAHGIKIFRTAELDGDTLFVHDEATWIPVEIPVSEIAAEKTRLRQIASGDPVLRAPLDASRYWQFDQKEALARLAKLDAAATAIIEVAPDEAWRHALRGYVRQHLPDKSLALADYDRAIELEPTAELYSTRASLHEQSGELEAAVADAQQAYDLDPSAATAITLAYATADAGEHERALTLLEGLAFSGDAAINLLQARAELAGWAGQTDAGWALLQQAKAARPGDGAVLNAQCWYMGTWNYALENALEICDDAVQANEYSPAVLDSRALVHYRLGKPQDALRDLNAALTAAPGQGSSLYLKGLIRIELGKEEGRQDIENAKRLYRSIDRQYRRYGLEPKV